MYTVRTTNRFNLPEAFIRFDQRNAHSRGDADLSATELIDSPRIRKLRMRYSDRITSDISERIMSILGTAVHNILEQGAPSECTVEERLFMDVGELTISGQIDLQTPTQDGVLISDYKTTGSYAVKSNPKGKPEWVRQLNVYAALAEANGRNVSGLEVIAVIRDWSAANLERQKDYPESPVVRIPIEMWSAEVRDQFIRSMAESHTNKGLSECSSEERWEQPTKYAVYGETSTRARKVFDNLIDAQEYMMRFSGVGRIEERIGESIRCKSYCPVSEYCSQWKEIQESKTDG